MQPLSAEYVVAFLQDLLVVGDTCVTSRELSDIPCAQLPFPGSNHPAVTARERCSLPASQEL